MDLLLQFSTSLEKALQIFSASSDSKKMSIIEDEEPLVSRGDIVGTEREREYGGVCLEMEGLETEVRAVAGVRFLGSEGRICFSGVAGLKSCRLDPNVRIEGNSSSPLHFMISRTQHRASSSDVVLNTIIP